MILYCQKCNNLIDKINNEILKEGEILMRKCSKCNTFCGYYVQYRAISERKMTKLTEKKNYATI